MSRCPQAKVEKRAPLARRGRTISGMADLGLRWWRERWGEVRNEPGVWSQNSRTRCGTQADRQLGPHSHRGTSHRARAPGRAAEAGCILMTHLPGRLSHERGEMCSVLVRRGSVVTRVHVARGRRLSEQTDAHRQAAARGGDGQCDRESDGSHSGRCSGVVNHGRREHNTPDSRPFLTLRRPPLSKPRPLSRTISGSIANAARGSAQGRCRSTSRGSGQLGLSSLLESSHHSGLTSGDVLRRHTLST